MKLIEKFSGIFLLAGLLLFLGATLALGVIPALGVDRLYPRQGLPTQVPEEMKAYYADPEKYASAVLRGRDLYIREACWHCHSQFVRPAGNESLRYGPVSTPGEYQSVLHLPQLFGTRRVGPDLSRQAGVHSNDWHFAHLYSPVSVVPESVMPGYPWYFQKNAQGVPEPKPDAVALVAYLQQLGWAYREHAEAADSSEPTMPPRE